MLHGLFLVAHVHLVILFLGPPFTGLHMHFTDFLPALALHPCYHRSSIGAVPVVQGVLVIIVVLAYTDGDLFVGSIIVKDGQLTLLVDRKGRKIKTLMSRPGLHDVTHVPFANVYRVVARL